MSLLCFSPETPLFILSCLEEGWVLNFHHQAHPILSWHTNSHTCPHSPSSSSNIYTKRNALYGSYVIQSHYHQLLFLQFTGWNWLTLLHGRHDLKGIILTTYIRYLEDLTCTDVTTWARVLIVKLLEATHGWCYITELTELSLPKKRRLYKLKLGSKWNSGRRSLRDRPLDGVEGNGPLS